MSRENDLQTDNSEEIKKVVVINGSPHKQRGNTGRMIEWLLEPVRRRNWSVNYCNIVDNTIELCGGCGRCIFCKTCDHVDDHDWIMKQMARADGIIIGSPSHFMSVTAQLKTFIDRCLPYVGTNYLQGKWALAVSPDAGTGGGETAAYLGMVMSSLGAVMFSEVTARATWPGIFKDKPEIRKLILEKGEQFCQILTEECPDCEPCPLNTWMGNMLPRKKRFAKLC